MSTLLSVLAYRQPERRSSHVPSLPVPVALHLPVSVMCSFHQRRPLLPTNRAYATAPLHPQGSQRTAHGSLLCAQTRASRCCSAGCTPREPAASFALLVYRPRDAMGCPSSRVSALRIVMAMACHHPGPCPHPCCPALPCAQAPCALAHQQCRVPRYKVFHAIACSDQATRVHRVCTATFMHPSPVGRLRAQQPHGTQARAHSYTRLGNVHPRAALAR